MKKLIAFILLTLIVITLCFSASAEDRDVVLSELSDEACLEFLVEYGVEIPSVYESNEDCLPFVRYVIRKVEQNYNVSFHFGAAYLYSFAEDIKAAVTEYYGISQVSTLELVYNSENILEDNTAIDTWNESYANMNCYAYAIGYDHSVEPGHVAWEVNNDDWMWQPCPTYAYPDIFTIVDYIETDLTALGYDVDTPSTISPEALTQVTAHNRLICVRLEQAIGGDFHLMVLKEDGMWYQKTRTSVPLRYHYSPTTSLGWTLEGLGRRGYFRDEDWVYDGVIYFIHYTIPCTNYSYVYSGIVDGCGTHILTCSECGNTKGIKRNCIYENNKCRICGAYKPAIMQSLLPDDLYS